MDKLRKAPRLDKIDPLALGQESAQLASILLMAFGLEGPRARSLGKKIGDAVILGVHWSRDGGIYPPGFRGACSLLTSPALGARVELPSDPDRLSDDTLGRLALVKIALEGREALVSREPMTAAQLAALASLSVRSVRDVLACHRSEDGTYAHRIALEFLQAQGVIL